MRILHATDFSEGAARAQAEAIRLARALSAEVVVVHVLVPVEVDIEALGSRSDLDRIRQARRRWAEGELERRVVEAHRAGLRARGLLRGGEPAAEILKAAGDEEAGLIVMGTEGRGAIGRLLVGSVADRVIRQARCPVVTVRAGASAGASP